MGKSDSSFDLRTCLWLKASKINQGTWRFSGSADGCQLSVGFTAPVLRHQKYCSLKSTSFCGSVCTEKKHILYIVQFFIHRTVFCNPQIAYSWCKLYAFIRWCYKSLVNIVHTTKNICLTKWTWIVKYAVYWSNMASGITLEFFFF